MTWRERDHPRHDDGRFRHKSGGWIEQIAARLVPRQAPQFVEAEVRRDGVYWPDWIPGPGETGPRVDAFRRRMVRQGLDAQTPGAARGYRVARVRR